MTKASPISIEQAATEIVALIHSRPTSPCPDEVEAIIGRAALNNVIAPGPNAGLSEWSRILDAYFETMERPETSDEQADVLMGALLAATRAILASPVRTWNDLVVRTAIAVHWNSDGGEKPTYPECALSGRDDDHYFAEQAVAHVVRAVCDLAKLSFDRDGRVLAEQPAAVVA